MKAKIFLFIALIISVLVNAQERTITGKVTDETGQALPGVSISIKGKMKGTTCDLNGKYSIQVEAKDVLIFSFVPSSLLYKSSHPLFFLPTITKTMMTIS